MPKLCDIVKPGVPCKVKHVEYSGQFSWNGHILDRGFLCGTVALFSDGWQLDEPTVESVMRERGYELCPLGRDFSIEPLNDQRPALRVFSDKKPVTVAQITAICDLLDQYKKPTEKAQ